MTATTRLAIGTDATKALRGMPAVKHRQTALGPDEQLVEIDVETGRIKSTAWGVGSGLAVAGAAGGVATALGMAGGSDLAQFLMTAVPVLVMAAGTTVIIAKGWVGAVRRGMQLALDGIAHPELHRRAQRRRQRRQQRDGRRPRSGFSRLVDEVADALDDLLD